MHSYRLNENGDQLEVVGDLEVYNDKNQRCFIIGNIENKKIKDLKEDCENAGWSIWTPIDGAGLCVFEDTSNQDHHILYYQKKLYFDGKLIKQ